MSRNNWISRSCPSRRSAQRGSTIIEFAILAFTLMVVLFTGIELNRMAFVYTELADAAKAGVRYAIVRGSTRPSGFSSSSDSSPVSDMVKYYVTAVDPSKLTVTVNYLDTNNNPGSRVQVLVSYTYDPWTGFPFLKNVALRANSQGRIAY
jgi:Flp pilus assembly protein TadG